MKQNEVFYFSLSAIYRTLPRGGRSTSPMVRPMRLGLWTLTRGLYAGREFRLGASGLYTSGSNESTENTKEQDV